MKLKNNKTNPDPYNANSTNRPATLRLLTFLFAATMLAAGLQACDDGGTVGSSFTPDESKVNTDTLKIQSTSEVSAPTFSGNEAHVSAGEYHDMLFGFQKTTALFQPELSYDNLDTIVSDASAYLELEIDEIYGNADASTEFTLYEINRRWRGRSWRPDSVAQIIKDGPIESSMGSAVYPDDEEDGILTVPVADFWLNEYREYFNDQDNDGYIENMFGFAMKTEGAENIISFNVEGSRLVVDNPADTLGHTGFRNVAYSLEADRETEFSKDESTLIYNTFENFMKLDFEITSEFIDADNISRAELVLYKDSDLLEQTLEPQHQRNSADVLDVYLLTAADLQLAIADEPIFQINYDEEVEAYRLNVTSYIRRQLMDDSDQAGRLHVITGNQYGKLLNTALFNHNSEEYFPRLLITSVDPE